MGSPMECPECGAKWAERLTCQEAFVQMMGWELETPSAYAVHHLMVLCYHLQHPSLYTPDGLTRAMKLLIDFMDNNLSPQSARDRDRDLVDSTRRTWKISGRSGMRGSYSSRMYWNFTAADVIAGGKENYNNNVAAWARSTLNSLRDTGNLPTD
ncbi:MAG: hypothetical protein HGA53_03145 [Anaerolineaceae bacterium]|nr:hypothetical protein [Anaerolineaceae bacterium]